MKVWIVQDHVEYEGSRFLGAATTAEAGMALAERWIGEWRSGWLDEEWEQTSRDEDNPCWSRRADWSVITVTRTEVEGR